MTPDPLPGDAVGRLRALAEKATPRPWTRESHDLTEWYCCMEGAGPAVIPAGRGTAPDPEASDDADLIVAAVNALPALLELVAQVDAADLDYIAGCLTEDGHSISARQLRRIATARNAL